MTEEAASNEHSGGLDCYVVSENDLYQIALRVAEYDFLDGPACQACGLMFQPFHYVGGQQSWIQDCCCDEKKHIETNFRRPLRHVKTWNRIYTGRAKS